MNIPEVFQSWSMRYETISESKVKDDMPISSSSDTPSTYRPNPHYERSKVVTAVAHSIINGRQVNKTYGLKVVPYGQHHLLENESDALKYIHRANISHKFVESFIDKGFYVLAFEWLGRDSSGNDWRSLNTVLSERKKPISEIWTYRENQIFVSALISCVSRLHNMGIVHGDIKDTHIFVNQQDKEQIRLIDFGLSQFRDKRSLWRGGSHGFSPPQYWKSYERPRPLTWDDLLRIDNYCLAATLYYVYTLQIFPLANPNFGDVLDDSELMGQIGFQNYMREVLKIISDESLESITNRDLRYLLQKGLSTNYKGIPLSTKDLIFKRQSSLTEQALSNKLFRRFFPD